MAKHYKYVNGKKLIVVNNYDLGSDIIPEEVELIPDITQADQGKVLTANSNGEPVWANVPNELPTITGNAGKVLKVNAGGTGTEWSNETTELPTLTGNAGKILKVNSGATGTEWANESTELPSLTNNAGKVLAVNSGATGVEWAAPSGGGIPVYSMVWGTPNYDDGFIPRYVNVDGTPADVFVVDIDVDPPTLESGWHLTGEVFDKDYSTVHIDDGKYTASITGEVYRFVDNHENIFYTGQDETGYFLGYVISNLV